MALYVDCGGQRIGKEVQICGLVCGLWWPKDWEIEVQICGLLCGLWRSKDWKTKLWHCIWIVEVKGLGNRYKSVAL